MHSRADSVKELHNVSPERARCMLRRGPLAGGNSYNGLVTGTKMDHDGNVLDRSSNSASQVQA
jgi:hypothetical protein